MKKNYCVNCGNEMEPNDRFCHFCGASAEKQKDTEQYIVQEDNVYEISPVNNKPIKTKRSQKVSLTGKKVIIVSFVLLALVASPFIVISILNSIRTPLGTLNYNVADQGQYELNISVYNDVGSITILYDNSITNLFEATLEVKGGIGASFEDAVNFESSIIEGTEYISFVSDQSIYNYFSMNFLSYEITILIKPTILVNYDVTSSTGSVDFYFNGYDNLLINDLSLYTSTGSVYMGSGASENCEIGEISLSSSTGSITLDFSDTFNTTVEDISVSCSTGSVDVFLGEQMHYFSNDINVETSTGSIDLIYEDLILYDDLDFYVETSTGSIDLEITQSVILSWNYTVDFLVSTSTGSIDVILYTSEDLGLEIDASTDTGGIHLPGGANHYHSEFYYQKNTLYNFDLSTSTGSIEVILNN